MSLTEVIEVVGIPAFVVIMAVGGRILLPPLWEVIHPNREAISSNPRNNPGYVEQATGPILRTGEGTERLSLADRTLVRSDDWTPLHRAAEFGGRR